MGSGKANNMKKYLIDGTEIWNYPLKEDTFPYCLALYTIVVVVITLLADHFIISPFLSAIV